MGNREVQPAQQRMLSRQVMQVTFNKGSYSVKGEEVRIHLATPYGVTRELAVPVAKVAPKPADPAAGFSFGTAKLVVQYDTAQQGAKDDPARFFPVGCGSGNDDGLKINWNAPGGTLTKEVTVTFEIDFGKLSITRPCECSVPGEVKGKTVVIQKAALDCLAKELVTAIGKTSYPRDGNPLDTAIKTTKVTITPVVPAGTAAQAAVTADQLTIEFKMVACCPPAAVAPQVLAQPKEMPKEDIKK